MAAQQFDILQCFTPCNFGYTGNEVIPGTGCEFYHECWEGVALVKSCGSPLIFNEERDYCDFPSEDICPSWHVTCPESYSPTMLPESNGPTMSPKSNPTTGKPTMIQTTSFPTPSPYSPGQIILPTTEKPTMIQTPYSPAPYSPPQTSQPITEAPTIGTAISHIESKKELIEEFVLVSYSASGLAYPSKSYTYEKFMQSLQIMGVEGFGADFQFNLFEGDREKYHYGLVNLAAFLSNAMVESIEYDTCDELNWQDASGRYALSNSCGQEGRSYQDETCGTDEDIFSCEVVPVMEMKADSSAAPGVLAPPPLECKPGSGDGYQSGYWDASSGTLIRDAPYSNDVGRTDTEGCCWWGRGALLTRGVCNIGKINYYLGKRGADLGRTTLYPTVDFCNYPEATCREQYTEELRWTIAFFEWSERVQRYETLSSSTSDGWNFEDQLTKFVDGGMVDSDDSDSFINSVSRILSRGCHASGCSELEVRMLDRRRANFLLIINEIFDIKKLLETPKPTSKPTRQPTQPPTRITIKQSTPWPSQRSAGPTIKPVVSSLSLPVGSPPQQITIRPITPNPTEIQEINPSPKESSSTNVDPSPAAPSITTIDESKEPSSTNVGPSPSAPSLTTTYEPNESSSTNVGPSPVAPSLTTNDESSNPSPDKINTGPVAQPEQPLQINGDVDEATYGDEYDGELIGIEGNFAIRISAKLMIQLKLFAVAIVLYCHII